MALSLYWWAIVIYVIISLLEQFNVINPYNQFVYTVHSFLFRIVEPVLSRIRRFLPSLGTIDISPLILLLIIHFFQVMVTMIFVKLL
jgi:YggT family protein